MAWPLNDQELAKRLGEAIRATLAGEHYPKPECECSGRPAARNLCGKRRLEEAFKLYLAHYPGEGVF